MQMQLKANLLYINFLTEGELQQYLGIVIFNFFVKLDNSHASLMKFSKNFGRFRIYLAIF